MGEPENVPLFITDLIEAACAWADGFREDWSDPKMWEPHETLLLGAVDRYRREEANG